MGDVLDILKGSKGLVCKEESGFFHMHDKKTGKELLTVQQNGFIRNADTLELVGYAPKANENGERLLISRGSFEEGKPDAVFSVEEKAVTLYNEKGERCGKIGVEIEGNVDRLGGSQFVPGVEGFKKAVKEGKEQAKNDPWRYVLSRKPNGPSL